MSLPQSAAKLTSYRTDVQAACVTCGKASEHDETAKHAGDWAHTHLAMNPDHALTVTTTSVAGYIAAPPPGRPRRAA